MSAGNNLLVLSRYDTLGASSRLRMLQYLPYVRAAGFIVEIAPFFSNQYLRGLYKSTHRSGMEVVHAYCRRIKAVAKAKRYSIVWIEKELFPYFPGTAEALLRHLKVPYIVDYDDATFHAYDQSDNRLVRWFLRNKLDPLLQGAFSVTAGNSYLAAYASRRGAPNVELVPTVIDLARYSYSPDPGGQELRIGWIGTPVTAKYLEIVRKPLEELAKRRAIRLVTVGAPDLTHFNVPLEQHAWAEATEAKLLANIHVGIMPLPDEPFERGKCGYKLIQYMACGRPVVASPVGVNVDIVSADVGFLAKDAEDWVSSLTALADNPSHRTALGNTARALVETRYSVQVTAPKLVGLLAEAARSN